MFQVILRSLTGSVYLWNAAPATRGLAKVLIFLLVLYIGLRPTEPMSEYLCFGDTFPYAAGFKAMQGQNVPIWDTVIANSKGEWLFTFIVAICAKYADVHTEFLICACVYVGCCVKFCTRVFKQHWVLPFLMFCSTFYFFTDGVNIVRNGMAASITILALSYREKKWVAIILCVLALGIHKSLLLMMASALLSWKITNSKYYIAGWLFAILLVIALGPSIGNWIGASGILDDHRLASYLIRDESKNTYYTGFRADFLLYSALPIITGGYFIFKKKYRDSFYIWIYNIYIACNAAWVVMMYAAFSDRFAHISWFLMPFVLIYPWLKKTFFQTQSLQLCKFLLVCYAYPFYAHIFMPTFFSN